MKQEKSIFEPSEVLPMSEETKQRLAEVAKKIEGKELFTNLIRRKSYSIFSKSWNTYTYWSVEKELLSPRKKRSL